MNELERVEADIRAATVERVAQAKDPGLTVQAETARKMGELVKDLQGTARVKITHMRDSSDHLLTTIEVVGENLLLQIDEFAKLVEEAIGMTDICDPNIETVRQRCAAIVGAQVSRTISSSVRRGKSNGAT